MSYVDFAIYAPYSTMVMVWIGSLVIAACLVGL